jgi:hypothetical protein
LLRLLFAVELSDASQHGRVVDTEALGGGPH